MLGERSKYSERATDQTARSSKSAWENKVSKHAKGLRGKILSGLMATVGSYSGVKRSRCAVGHSSPASNGVKNEWICNAPYVRENLALCLLILLVIILSRIFTILYLNKTMFINHIVSQVFYSYRLWYM